MKKLAKVAAASTVPGRYEFHRLDPLSYQPGQIGKTLL